MPKHSMCFMALVILLGSSLAIASAPTSLNARAAECPDVFGTCDHGVAPVVKVDPGRGGQDVLTWVNKATIPEAVSRTTGAFDDAGQFHLVCGNCQTHTSHPYEQVYDPVANSWSQGHRCPAATPGVDTGLHNLDCIGIGNQIYVGGGSHGSAGFYDKLSVIDVDLDTWIELADMPVSQLIYYKMAAAGGKAYVFGGAVGGTTVQSAAYQYDPSGGWTQVADMPGVRRDVMTATVGDTIYVMGGYDGSTAYSTVWKYSVSGNTYTVGTSLPEARWWGRAVVYTDPVLGPVIYLMGGYNASGSIVSTVNTYTVNTGVWGTETSMLLTLRSHAAAISGAGQIFVAGGYSGAIQGACEMAVVAPAAGVDVGVSLIHVPGTQVAPGVALTPSAVVRNFGTTPQSGIPVRCIVDSFGTLVYDHSITITGPVSAGDTASATFSPNWTPGTSPYYTVKFFTSLSGDTTRSNDTAKVVATTWTNIAPPLESLDRIVHATVYDPVGDKIYVIGGNPAGATATYLNLNSMYDPGTNTWYDMATMPTARGWCSGVYCHGFIYVIGGHNNSSAAIATNEAYDIAGDQWTTVTARPRVGLAALSCVWNDSLIYILGGWDGSSSSGMTNVDIYDPANDAWLTGTALPQNADMGGAAIIGDTIYITNAVARATSACWANLYKGYIDPSDPATITWIQGPALATPTSITGAAAVGGKVYWVGGFLNLTTPTNAVWVYDPATGAVTNFPASYPVTISRLDNAVGRTAANELYVMAGDSGCNWAAPNRKYAKISVPTNITGIGEKNPTATLTLQSSVRPNPSTGNALVSYTLPRAGSISLKLYNAAGKLVKTLVSGSRPVGTSSFTLNSTTLAKGVYLLKLETEGSARSTKFIIE